MQSPNGNQPWCPGQSLWSLIAEHVSRSELSKIRAALGHSLVDMYTEVHNMAELWHKRWQATQQGGHHSSRAGTPFPRQQGSPLADPPAVKELVRAEVKMLLHTLRERASRGGREGEEILSRYKVETVNYALSHRDNHYKNCTNPEDTDDGRRPSSHCSAQCSAEGEIEAVRDKLNVMEIDDVVERLRSVLMAECEALTSLIKHLKGNIKQKHQTVCESDKPEPSLAELRELREAVQMDLELYPSSLDALSPLPVKTLKNRLSTGRSSETLLALNPSPELKPHPPTHLCHPKPRPPSGSPLTKTSLSRTSSLRRITSPLNNSSETPPYNTTDASDHSNSQNAVIDHNSPSPQQDCVHHRSSTSDPNFCTKSQRSLPILKTHLSPQHSLSREDSLSPQMERKGSSACMSRKIHIPLSPVRALGRLCDAGSSSVPRSVPTANRSGTQNGQQNSSCGRSLESVKADNDGKTNINTSGSSVIFETGSPHAQTVSTKSNSGDDRNKNSCSSHTPENATCTQAPSARMNGQLLTSPKNPHGGATSQHKTVQDAQTKPRFLNRFYQPVPPARVPT